MSVFWACGWRGARWQVVLANCHRRWQVSLDLDLEYSTSLVGVGLWPVPATWWVGGGKLSVLAPAAVMPSGASFLLGRRLGPPLPSALRVKGFVCFG